MTQSRVTEALLIFLISIVVFYLIEISIGVFEDQFIATMMMIESARPEMTSPVLSMLAQFHKVLLLFVIMLAVWVIRVATARTDYSRNY